jgi:4-amino-4-deoxy-L-arabinose transferase-like glycosyltransferase
VVATALLAFQLGGSIAAVIAAVLLAFTPVFIHHSIQPMSDVPVTAAWMVCFLLVCGDKPSGLSAGMACAIAVLIRPNLAPLAIVPLFLARRRIAFSIPVAIAGIGLAVLQSIWYGSPLRSGYGSAEELFAISNVVPNASRYLSWLLTTSPILLASLLGFFRLRRDRVTQSLFAFVVLVIGSYLVYAVFDDWSYLRFLLPALAIMAVFAAVELAAWLERGPMAARAPALFALLLAITAYGVWSARAHDTFRLADQLRRIDQVAHYINADVPAEAVIVSGEQSGSMRYYSDRPILRWESATPESLATAMTTLEQSHRPVFIVLDAWEDGLFRQKFSTLPGGALDWPPILDAGTSHRTRLWKLSDRGKFLSGEKRSTIRLP